MKINPGKNIQKEQEGKKKKTKERKKNIISIKGHKMAVEERCLALCGHQDDGTSAVFYDSS